MRWSLTIYALIGLSSFCDAAPASSNIGTETLLEPRSPETDSPSSSSLSSARTLPVHEVGLPSELAWQAWLVVASKPDSQSSFESATVPRRISPKSVFVAPRLEATSSCSDGYKADGSGGCVADTIQINPQDHWNFVIERINAMYPKVAFDDSAATGTEPKNYALSGPLQVNISLGIDDNSPPSWSEKHEREKASAEDSEDSEEDTVEISVVQVPPQKAALTSDGLPATKTEAALTLYEVGNATKTGEEKEETFFRGTTSEPVEDHTAREVVVPVAELLEDKNQTFAEVIDYEIPVALKQLFNASLHDTTESDPSAKNITKAEPTDDARLPTVVLLLSPSKLTTAASTSHSKESNPDQETSSEQILVKKENVTVESTEKKTTPLNVGGQNSPSEDTDDDEDGLTVTDDGLEETTLYETTEIISTTSYPEEELDNATEWNDEILAHGEAGSVLSEDNFEPSTSANGTAEEEMVSKSENEFVEKNTAEESSKITSESSIHGDVIVETTLLDLNTGAITGATPTHEKLDDYRELFEADKEIELEPEVVFSPQDSHRLDQTNTRNTKRAEDEASKSSSSTEKRQPISFLVRTESPIEMEDVLTAQSSPQAVMQSYVSRPNEPKENPTKRRIYSNQDYVRFPEEPRRQPSASSGYVLFPPDNSNSINGGNLRYKESSSHVGGSAVPQVVSKTNVPYNQRNTHWRLPPGWRIDDLQPPPQPVTAQNFSQRQNPMLLRFWTRMPLFRDPSLPSSSRVLPIANQRGSIYRQISAQSGNRVFPQTVRGSNPVQQFG